MPTVTLYTRPDCGLCDQMKKELTSRGYQLQEVNVDDDPELKRQYGLDVPVAILSDGSILAKHRLDS
jgi:glutaredoxin